MSQPQSGIIPEPSQHALFLVLGVKHPEKNAPWVALAASRLPAMTRHLAASDPQARLVSVVSFGPEFWGFISPSRRPAGFRHFLAMEAGGRRAPHTGGDLLIHIISERHDLCFELAMQVMRELRPYVEVMDEVHGFRYLDSRDLTGFIDGTENPKGAKKRAAVALIGKEDLDFAGGSFVFTQRYIHNLKKWEALSVEEQEAIIGRRKRDSKQLTGKAKPPTAHISRVVIEEDGEELEILRHSFPYGKTSEAGLFFIAYNKTLSTFGKMLSRMIGTTGDGLHDRQMDFTRAVTGATFFAPSLKVLKTLGAG